MKIEIKRGVEAEEFETSERCFIREISNTEHDENVSIAIARVMSGVTTAWHLLRETEERYIVIAGEGLVEIGDTPPCAVTAGDVVLIPKDTQQRILNTGVNDLLFYAICSPRFQQSNYVDLEGREGT
ncbi:MAG: cupin domain-containing protein [Pseudomonadales bacterium]